MKDPKLRYLIPFLIDHVDFEMQEDIKFPDPIVSVKPRTPKFLRENGGGSYNRNFNIEVSDSG